MAKRVRSYSKINLGLAVGPARPDGFHGLTTLYQTLALHDFVTVNAQPANETRLTLSANHPGVPCTASGNAEKNTAYRIVVAALEALGVNAHVHIEIEKNLPVQGGLGAGSANAAAALLGLERELGRALPGAERFRLAAEVGSDVPLFLLGGTVLGLGRGEEVYPMADLPRTWCVVAVPTVGVSTRLAFADLDKRMADEGSVFANNAIAANDPAAASNITAALTFPQPADRLKQLSRVLSSAWSPDGIQTGPSGITRSGSTDQLGDLAENPLLALVRTGIENDFEQVAFSQHPSLRSTKRDLQGSGPACGQGSAIFACLSGSGSALFGLYANEADARAAQQRVLANGAEGGAGFRTQALLTETLPRQVYWDTMFAE
jgi:4-diphosphocytidyl-2-C-methyl-D-erythritol kinase